MMTKVATDPSDLSSKPAAHGRDVPSLHPLTARSHHPHARRLPGRPLPVTPKVVISATSSSEGFIVIGHREARLDHHSTASLTYHRIIAHPCALRADRGLPRHTFRPLHGDHRTQLREHNQDQHHLIPLDVDETMLGGEDWGLRTGVVATANRTGVLVYVSCHAC